MKISGRTIVIGLITLLIAGATIGYYFLTNKDSQSLGWTSSSWLYRKSLDIPNNETMQINKVVRVTLDTASLISMGKLQNDCDDLRFLDNDEYTSLKYWIEKGCNTSSTEILLEIPLLPRKGKSIYLLYGNPTVLSSQEKLTIDK